MNTFDSLFDSLGLNADIVSALERAQITTPTPVQRLVIPRVLSGESIVVRSQTGSGKSLAYLLPLLQILQSGGDGFRGLILLPTRELAQQVGRVVCSIDSDVSMAIVYGGVDYDAQREVLCESPQIVVATPGRLRDFISQGVDVGGVTHFVLDEVDQMVDMGFRDAIVELSRLRAEGAQTLCFSATLCDEVRGVVGDVEEIVVEGEPLAAQRIAQSGYFVEQPMMSQLLIHLIRAKSPERAIVFCRSRKMADALSRQLNEAGVVAEAIHSDRSQAAREHILRRFSEGQTALLVATDLMARGIDVDGVTHVFNFGLPLSSEQYVHRIGRTGRAGASGEAISLMCPDEKSLLDATCKMMRQPIPISQTHPFMTPAVSEALNPNVRQKRRGKR